MLFLMLTPDAGGAQFIDLTEVPSGPVREGLSVPLANGGEYNPTVREYTYRTAEFALPPGRPYSDAAEEGGVLPTRRFRLLLSNDFPITFPEAALANTVLVAASKFEGGDVALASVKDAEFPLV